MSGKWVSGFHAIEEIISSGDDRGEVLYSKINQRIEKIVSQAGKKGIPVRKTGRDTLDRIAGPGNHRGIIFLSSGKDSLGNGGDSSSVKKTSGVNKYLSVEDFLDNPPGKNDLLILILDGITDPHNLGAILRSADLFDVDLVIHPKKTAPEKMPPYRKSLREQLHGYPWYRFRT